MATALEVSLHQTALENLQISGWSVTWDPPEGAPPMQAPAHLLARRLSDVTRSRGLSLLYAQILHGLHSGMAPVSARSLPGPEAPPVSQPQCRRSDAAGLTAAASLAACAPVDIVGLQTSGTRAFEREATGSGSADGISQDACRCMHSRRQGSPQSRGANNVIA